MISESPSPAPNASSTPVGVYSLGDPVPVDVIVVSGADASRFLQGQLSCNLQHLTPQRSLRGVLCNLKGRVIANVRLLADGDNILMQTAAGMGQVIIDTLKKYQVFFKVDLQLATERFLLLEAALAPDRLPEGMLPISLPEQSDASSMLEGLHITRLPDLQTSLAGNETQGYARFEGLIDRSRFQPEFITTALDAWLARIDAAWWPLADITSGIAHVRPGQQEAFTPQLLNYDINGTVDFKKGCYTGQEVVARMYYRAQAKRRMYYGQLDAGQSLVDCGINADDVIASHKRPDGRCDLLTIADTDADKRPSWLTAVPTNNADITATPAADSPESQPPS